MVHIGTTYKVAAASCRLMTCMYDMPVWNISTITESKITEMIPRRGRLCAARTLGCAFPGPGPIRILCGTCKGQAAHPVLCTRQQQAPGNTQLHSVVLKEICPLKGRIIEPRVTHMYRFILHRTLDDLRSALIWSSQFLQGRRHLCK